jgi:glycosidase
MHKMTIYELWLNAFSKEGTLRGAIPGLKRVADLGAMVVYLGPIAKRSATPDTSPYNIADYNAIDPKYGNEQDLHDFVAVAHKLSLKVMLDIVYYHSAPDNVIMKIPKFFVKTGDGKTARGFWPQALPDYRNPEVRKYLVDSLVHWVRDFGVDGFRCDVGAGVPLSFWAEASNELDRVNPGSDPPLGIRPSRRPVIGLQYQLRLPVLPDTPVRAARWRVGQQVARKLGRNETDNAARRQIAALQ